MEIIQKQDHKYAGRSKALLPPGALRLTFNISELFVSGLSAKTMSNLKKKEEKPRNTNESEKTGKDGGAGWMGVAEGLLAQ